MSTLQRTLIAAVLFSTWMVCLFSGWILGGVIHLALALSLVLFPWRELRR
jgi:hypothetical protein